MSIVIGDKIKTPQGDFGGDGYALKLHQTNSAVKFRANNKTLSEIVDNPEGSALIVPVYNGSVVRYFVGFEYIDTSESKKLPAGKVSKNGIFNASKKAREDIIALTNPEGEIGLKPITEEMGIVVPTTDSGNLSYKPGEFADQIANQFNIELRTFKVYEVIPHEAAAGIDAASEDLPKEEVQA